MKRLQTVLFGPMNIDDDFSFQRANELIGLYKVKTGDSKNLSVEISSLTRPTDFFQMTNSHYTAR